MRTPASDGPGHRRTRWRGRDDDPADADGRPEPTAGGDTASRGVGSAGSARARSAEPAGPRGSGPHEGPGWDAASRAAVGRRHAFRQRDAADRDGVGRPKQDPGSVFAPDFSRTGPDPAQPDPGRLEAAGILRTAAPAVPPKSWYESGTAGKGPVRGYPPAPGQPLPLYPPGQFAAWNRHRDGGPPGRGGSGGGPESPTAGGEMATPQAGVLQPDESGDSASGPLSRYYARDSDPGLNPGYATLAVSDPAADVTETQTWRALAEGRATGIWAAPPGRGSGAAGQPAPGARAGSRAIPLTPATGRPVRSGGGRPGVPGGHATVSGSPAVAASDADGTVADPRTGSRSATRRASSRHSGAHTGPQPSVRQASPEGGHRNPRTEQPSAAAGTGAIRPEPRPQADPGPRVGRDRGRASQRALRLRRSRPGSVHLAIVAAALLILAAAGTLGYTVLHNSGKPKPAPQSTDKKAASASPGASLGPYGHIASRQTDPQPLTLAELYPASFSLAGNSVSATAALLGSTCGDAIVGATLQSAAGAADCTQVARATYVDASGIMATIGVLNLSSGDAAKTAAQSADANDYISQLAGPTGPSHSIGQGTGIEEAAAKGHYLILIWAELTSQATPSAQQTALIEGFMTGLLQNTVNRDLTTRMLSGTP